MTCSLAFILQSPYFMRILIVDDSNGTLNALRIGLTSFGYRVTTASNGIQALHFIVETLHSSEKPDLLLTDFKMPRMNGLQLIASARAVSDELPVILMTGYGDKTIHRRTLALDRFAYLEKPFQPEELVKIIQRLVTLEAFGRPAEDSKCHGMEQYATNILISYPTFPRKVWDSNCCKNH